MVVRRFDIVLVRLDPTVGSEMRKMRPCVVVTPDDMNLHLQTLLVAPMTTSMRRYPFRILCRFQRRQGQIAVDQLRVIDRTRISKRLGVLDPKTQLALLKTLRRMFAP